MVFFQLNICESESESESVSGRIFFCLVFGELLFSDFGTQAATTATTMGVSDMCIKTSVTDAYGPQPPPPHPTNTKIELFTTKYENRPEK